MNGTHIYTETMNAAIDHAIETGQDEILDLLHEMDQITTPTQGQTSQV